MAKKSQAERIRALGVERLAGMTARQIAAKVGCSHVYARAVLRKAGLKCKYVRPGPKGRGVQGRVALYLDSGLPYQTIADKVGTTRASVATLIFRLRRLREAREGRA